MNKILFIIAGSMLLLTSALVEAQAPAPPEPKELEALRTRYQTDTQAAVNPIQLRYIADLKRLMAQATTAGKLEQALAVKAELDAVSNAKIANTNAEFKDLLIGSIWNWNDSFKFNITKRGEAATSFGQKCSWKSLQPYTIEYRFQNGIYGTIVFDRALTNGTSHETEGATHRTNRLTRRKD